MDVSAYTQRSRFWVQEFLVDLLGCLVPGVIFLFFAVVAIIWPFARLYGHLIHDSLGGPGLRTQTQTVAENGYSRVPRDSQNRPAKSTREQAADGKGPASWETYKSLWETLHAEIVILFFALSYAIGFVFLTSDPRLPDARSVWTNRKSLLAEKVPAIYVSPEARGDCRLVRRGARDVIESFLGKRPRYLAQLVNEGKMDVEFPYANMRQYLRYRKLEHLAAIIPWDARDKGLGRPETTTSSRSSGTMRRASRDEGSRRPRTTAFINMLKARLGYALPDKCGHITRNEAHIRLMSSVWYMARLVQGLAVLSIVLVVLGAPTVCGRFPGSAGRVWEVSAPCLGVLFLIVLTMWYVRAGIEQNLHYQRVREILYVLETAHFAKACKIWENGQKTAYPQILKGLDQQRSDDTKARRPRRRTG